MQVVYFGANRLWRCQSFIKVVVYPSHLVSAPVPDRVDGQSHQTWPGEVAGGGVTEQVHVVVAWHAARVVVVVSRVVRDGVGVFGDDAVKSANLLETL